MTDEKFLHAFEALNIKAASFDHEAHLRYGYLCLQADGLESAVKRVSQYLNAFATNAGAPEKYHQTITEALLTLMATRLNAKPSKTWSAFLQDNPDLVKDARAVLLMYYSCERLFSDEARKTFLAPDLLPFEAACLPLVS